MDACIKCELYYLAILKEKLCVVVNYIHKKKQILFSLDKDVCAGQFKSMHTSHPDTIPSQAFQMNFGKGERKAFGLLH